MAIAKVIYKESSSATGEVWMDVTQKTVTSATMLSDITALKNDGTGVVGNIALKSVTNLKFSSSTATFVVPSGYYSGAINWTITSKGAETFTPAETAQTITSYQWLTGSQTIAAIPSDYVGTGITRQGVGGLAIDAAGVIYANEGYYSETVSMNMATVSAKTITPTESVQRAVSSHYFTTGHISVAAISSTYVGTPVPIGTVSFDSGTGEFTVNSGYFSSKHVTSLTTSYTHTWIPTESVQVISSRQWLAGQQQINAISSTYVGTGVSTKAAATIYPSTVQQTIASQRYLTGTQTFAPVTTLNLEASYIASGITVKVGDSSNAGRIANVTGTLKGAESFAAIYKSLAYRSVIASSASYVSEWANSLSFISYAQFAGQPFSGSFTFGNVTYISEYGFACPYTNQATALGTVNFTFPECTHVKIGAFTKCGITVSNLFLPKVISLSGAAFLSAKISNISAPLCEELGASAFGSCSNITSIYLPLCSLILNDAFKNAQNLQIASFPSCESIYGMAFYSCSKLSSISFPKCKIIGANAFAYCVSLTEAYFPLCELVSSMAFYTCTNLISANFPKCSIISTGAFSNCSKLTTISFPLCELISSTAFCWCSSLVTADFSLCQCISTNAFSACYNLQSISFPVCSRIERSAFYLCKSLSSVYFPQCSFIGNSAFQGCSVLTTVNFPACLSIESDVFSNCSALIYASFPICTTISQNAFWGTALQSIDFPSCTYVGPQAFSGCSSLSIVSLINCTSFRDNIFRNCVQLISLYLGSSIPIFGNGMFNYTPISTYSAVAGRFGSIYVPSSMLDSYKTATNWATYSSRMVGY